MKKWSAGLSKKQQNVQLPVGQKIGILSVSKKKNNSHWCAIFAVIPLHT